MGRGILRLENWKISEGGGERNMKLMMKSSFALHRQRACGWQVATISGGEID